MSDGLHRITCRIGDSKPLYQHLLAGETTWLWVDTGVADTPETYLVPYVERLLGAAPARQYAIVTHADVDHFGGLQQLRARYPSLVGMAHRDDARLVVDRRVLMSQRYLLHRDQGMVLPQWRQRQLLERAGAASTVEIELAGGEVVDLGSAGLWEVVHLPGHSAGHLGLWEPDSRRMILGDAVLGWGMQDVAGTLVAPPPYYHLHAYLETIARLEGLAIDVLYSSHFPVMRGDEVAEFLASCRDAVQAIGTAVEDARPGTRTLAELCELVGASLDTWPPEAWAGLADPVSAHLKHREAVAR